MLSRTALRASSSATTSMVARRGFHSTRSQMSSPYHYPEGPRNNIPFNPMTKWFALRYWGFMGNCVFYLTLICCLSTTASSRVAWERRAYANIKFAGVGFGLPFGVAGNLTLPQSMLPSDLFSLRWHEYWRNILTQIQSGKQTRTNRGGVWKSWIVDDGERVMGSWDSRRMYINNSIDVCIE